MQNISTYKDLGYLFDEVYDGEIGDTDQQKNEFVSRLCQGHEEMSGLAENIWFTMIDIYKGNFSNDEKPQYVQIIKSNLSEINEFLEENRRFYKYEDLLELVEKVANQEYDSLYEKRQAFAFRLCQGKQNIFPIAEDIWFTVINIRDGVVAEPERDKYIAIVNSTLSEINELLDDPEKINDYEDLLKLIDDIAEKVGSETSDGKALLVSRLSQGYEELYGVINEIFGVLYNICGCGSVSEKEKNDGILFINSMLSEINEFLETKKNIQKSSEVEDKEKLDAQQGNQGQNTFAQIINQQKYDKEQGMTLGK